MINWLVVWGVTQAAGLVFKPILEDLVKESAKDYTKDFFKDCLKKVIHLPEKDPLKEAYGKALTQFLQLVQQELERADYDEVLIKQYIQPFKRFVNNETVAATLGNAFNEECLGLDTRTLAQTWNEMDLPVLPDEFDWGQISKRYLRRVNKIIRKSERLQLIFTPRPGDPPEFNLKRYREGLVEQYGNLRLDSLDTRGCVYNELKLWRIFVAQNVRECQEFVPQVYDIPKEHLRQLRSRGELEAEIALEEVERYRTAYVGQPIRPVLDVVGDPGANEAQRSVSSHYTVILGDPGSGKSTLLQYLALKWAERPLKDLPAYPIPLLIELRTYARNRESGQYKSILEFLHQGNITCRLNQNQLREWLKQGHAIAMFDGLDEVFDPALREVVVTDIHSFTNDYPNVQTIVTSRWLGYKAQRLRDAGFRHFMLQELEPEQIADFIQRWHDLTFPEGEDKVRRRERLQKAVTELKPIQELAGNPLLLTMMAILNRNQELPRDRAELYNQASRVLLHHWDVEVKVLENPELKKFPIVIDYKDKQAMLRQVAYRMQGKEKGLAGNLIGSTELESILTEYLKSIEVQQARAVARLMREQLRTRNFILCYLGADSYAFIHRTFLEYFCAWEFVWQFKETRTLSLEQLKQEVFGKHWQDESWHEVLRLIAGMIDAKFVGEIIEYLIAQQEEGVFNLLLAANCLAEVRNRTTIAPVATRLLEALKHSAEHDKDNFVRSTAVEQIAQGWKQDPDTLPFLIGLAEKDENNFVRSTAVEQIAQGWKQDPDIFPLIRDRAKDDENNFVRSTAVRELAKGWKQHPDTRPFLQHRAKDDENNFVRSTAVYQLAQGWNHLPEMFEILYNHARNDPYTRGEDENSKRETNPRQTALKVIVRNYPNNPHILDLLRDRSDNDPDDQVREFAKRQLERIERRTSSVG